MSAEVRFCAMPVIWCDGKWLGSDELPVSAMDRGSILGLSLFETILAVNGKPKFAMRHLRRLGEGCERLGWPLSCENLENVMTELLVRNDLAAGNAKIRLTMTAGSGEISAIQRGKDAAMWMAAFPAKDFPQSVAVTLSLWKRNEHSPLAGLKCASYAENLLALDHAEKAGFDETIFFNTADQLCEAAMANIFIVRNSRVLTPPLDSGCLAGITRSVVIEVAEKHGLICKETPLERTDLENADEIFLTSAIRGPVAVARLDQRIFPSWPVAGAIRRWWMEEIFRI